MGGRRGHEPGRLLSLAATLMLLARRSTEDPPERREAVQRPHAGLLLRAPHHSSRRMALRYFTLSSSLCAETIGGAWEVRLEKNMERVRAMLGISFYLYEVGSARAPKGFPWWTAGMKMIDPRVPNRPFEKPQIFVRYIIYGPILYMYFSPCVLGRPNLVSARLSSITPQKQRDVLRPSNHIF